MTTVTMLMPPKVSSVLEMTAFNWPELTKVVVTPLGESFQKTCALDAKLLPVSVMFVLPDPAGAVLGVTVIKTGKEPVIAKTKALVLPELGSETLTCAVPADDTSVPLIVAVN